MFRLHAWLVLLLLVCLPTVAQAQWVFTPHFGSTFGGDANDREHPSFGGAVTVFDEDAFGWEADVAFVPDAFAGRYGSVDFTGSNSHVLSVMGNAVIGLPVRGQHRQLLRPYVTLGAGFMQMHVASPDGGGFFKTTTHEAGWNAGAGAIAFITSRIGIRGDVRYLRSFQDRPPSWTRGIDVDVAPGNFDFFRATVGVCITGRR
jgi:opacity protein-like surface antigen